MLLLSDQNYRLDGRKPPELRQIRCKLGVFQQPDGSAYIEQGNTKVLAAVYGPHEPSGDCKAQTLKDRAFIKCEYSQASFSGAERKKRSRGDRKGKELSMHIKETFEAAIMTSRYPRSQIDICLQVLQLDGGNFSTCVNAATLALIDAGIALKDYVCACSVSLVKGETLVDINHLEQSSDSPELSVALLPKLDEIVYFELNSRMHEDDLGKALDAAVAGCKDVFSAIDLTVQDHVKTMAQTVS